MSEYIHSDSYINPLPNIILTPSTVSICNGSSTLLTAGGAGATGTYSWTPATGLSATTGLTVTANPGTTTVYTVTGKDVNGCQNTASSTVTVNSLPTITVNSPSICTGSSTALTAGGAGATGTYSWTPATNLSATTGLAVTANPASTTVYTVTGKDVNGCQNTATSTVTVNPLPTITINPSPASICAGLSTALTAGGAGATGTYSWSPATGLSATTGATSSVTPNPGTTTIYMLQERYKYMSEGHPQ